MENWWLLSQRINTESFFQNQMLKEGNIKKYLKNVKYNYDGHIWPRMLLKIKCIFKEYTNESKQLLKADCKPLTACSS